MTLPTRKTLLASTLGVVIAFAGVNSYTFAQSSGEASPQSKNSTLERADEDMAGVLKKLQELGAKPIGTQSVEQTRNQPTPADAVKAVLKDQGKDLKELMAKMNVAKQDMSYPTEGGSQDIRIYTPEGEAPEGGWPVIVYYHGGGWVIAGIDTYEASAMALANQTQAIVASAAYRQAPEHKFPAAHEDAFAAYKWALENANEFDGDSTRVAVAGESAGGNLAINTAIMARDQNVQMPEHMLLVYPIAGSDLTTESYQKNAEASPLSRSAMQWFFDQTISEPADMQDPRIDLVGQADLKNLPDATIIAAEIDPLRSEGKTLADKLEEAGSDVTYESYEGVTHEFFGMAAVLDEAKSAQKLASDELKEALSESSPN
ncbi:MAG TPA: alpha/beta hydrolase [Pseudomonas xinjiangensis]|uniref:Alpha/beta hydrolase n=2 Tax=root TaxID=1 RepID=A0A7V1BQG2_9GAMM|nr:alpha/beta hydrolase [Halopseudomonas xinjiangensis]HEC46344.1 alpha/beta hydrolase [Halopseudomonas xinjiangensis]